MATRIKASDITLNPAYYLYQIDNAHAELQFLEVTRETYRLSAFLDNRIAFTKKLMHSFPIDTVIDALSVTGSPHIKPDFIIHTSFCCSTLLARTFQVENAVMVLREPWVLRQLADMRRQCESTGVEWEHIGIPLIDLALTMLSKVWESETHLLIKPTNLANNLITDLLAIRPEAKAVFLYSQLEDFLISTLKKTSDTQNKFSLMATLFTRDLSHQYTLPKIDITSLDLLQCATVVWACQQRMFQQVLETLTPDRGVALDSEILLHAPDDVVAALNDFYGYQLGHDDIQTMTGGPTWKTHAKDPRASYGRVNRQSEHAEIMRRHAAWIIATMKWSEGLLADFGVAGVLSPAILA